MIRKTVLAAVGTLLLLLVSAYYLKAQLASNLLSRSISGVATIGEISALHWAGATVRDIRLSNADFEASANEARLIIDLPALLFDNRLVIRIATLNRANIHIAPSGPREPATSKTAMPLVVLRQFSISESSLVYRDADQDVSVTLGTCEGAQEGTSVTWQCSGKIQEERISAEGTYGLPDASNNTEPFSLYADWRDVKIDIEGSMDHPLSLDRANLELSASAAEGAPLLALLGIREIRDSPIDLHATYRDDGSVVDISAEGTAGGMQLNASGSARDLASLREAEFSVRVEGPSLFEAGALVNYLNFRNVPFSVAGNVSRQTDTGLVVRDLRLSVEEGDVTAALSMPAFPDTDNMDLELQGANMPATLLQPLVGTCELPAEALAWQGTIKVDDSGIENVQFQVTGDAHSLAVEGTLNTGNVSGAVDLAVSSNGFTFRELGRCFNLELADIPTRLDTEFTWQSGQLTFRKIDLESSIFAATGRVTVRPEEDVPFDIQLVLNTPDARILAESLLVDPGPLNGFPLSGQLSMKGDRNSIPAFSFDFMAAGHEGSISGSLGRTATLDGMDLALSIGGDNLRALLVDTERQSDAPQPFRIGARLKRSADLLNFSDIDLHIAKTDIVGSAMLSTKERFVGSSIQLSGRGGNLENLMGPWVDLPVPNVPFEIAVDATNSEEGINISALKLQAGEHSLDASLFIDRPPDFSRSSGEVRLRGPSTISLLALLGIDQEILDRPYDFSASIEGDVQSLLIRDIILKAGETDLSGDFRYTGTMPPTIDAKLVSRHLYLPLLDPGLLDKTPAVEEKKSSVLSADPLPLSILRSFNGNVAYTAEKVWANPEYETSLRADVRVQDGGISTEDFRWGGVHAEGTMRASLIPADDSYAMQLSARSDRLPIIWLLAGESEPSTGTSFHLDVSAKGNSTKTLMGSMNGTMLFKGGGGKIKGTSLNLFFGDFMQNIAANITSNRDPSTRISCTAGAINIENGAANVNPGLVARTDKVDVFATGVLNLKSETPDLTILTKSRTGIGLSASKIVAPRLKVKGTLADPKFQVDTTGTAINAWLALSSGGMSLIASGLWDRMTSAGDACGSLYQEAIKLPAYVRYREPPS